MSIGTELEQCAKQEAETATYIRHALQQRLGEEAAAAILMHCQQRVMRDSSGKSQRYWVDATGTTLRLAPHKNVALE